jgi:hypothetical protein
MYYLLFILLVRKDLPINMNPEVENEKPANPIAPKCEKVNK